MIASAAALLLRHRGLLLDHAGHYAVLAQAEAEMAARQALGRVVWILVALAAAVVAVTLAGTAWMLAATAAPLSGQGTAALWLAPGLPALLAAIGAWRATRTAPAAFARLRQQLHADLQLLRPLRGDSEHGQAGGR